MIRFDSVTKTYRGTKRPALNDLSLEILKGEFVFLVGASGSGKSSFLRLVLKEEKPTRGQIHVLGQQLASLPSRKVPYFRRSLGVVFQDFRLLPGKTVFDNVAFTLQVIGKSKGFIQEAVPDVLKLVGLEGKEGRMPHELSGGEQQRVAIARAVVNKPAILLADEPTGNLDPVTSAGIMSLLSAINANGTTVVMATHDVGIVDEMRRRVVELVGGQLVRDERSGGYQTQAIPVQDLEAALVERAEPDAAHVQARVQAEAQVRARAAAQTAADAQRSAMDDWAAQGQPTRPAPEQPASFAPAPQPAVSEPAASQPAPQVPPASQPAPSLYADPQPAATPQPAAQPASAPAPQSADEQPDAQPATPQAALASAVARATAAINLPGREPGVSRGSDADTNEGDRS